MTGDQIELLKMRLLRTIKQKIYIETKVCKLRNIEWSYSEVLAVTKAETDVLKEQLEELKATLSQTNQQISMIDICQTSEITKIETQKNNVHIHMKGFEYLFDKERNWYEKYNKELEEKETAERDLRKKKEEEIMEKNEQIAREIAAIEADCSSIERECAVLKKRNNAIMLKLRRKLVDTENIRKDLMRRKGMYVFNVKLTDEVDETHKI